jgi:hypothetical protein
MYKKKNSPMLRLGGLRFRFLGRATASWPGAVAQVELPNPQVLPFTWEVLAMT